MQSCASLNAKECDPKENMKDMLENNSTDF